MLRLSGNQLAQLPQSIGNLKELVWLNLAGNLLTELPESIGNLRSLEHLLFHLNKVVAPPSSLDPLSNLVGLSANENSIDSSCPSLRKMSKLKRLALSLNDLPEVPDGIELCESLEIARFEGNARIDSLPVGMAALPNLRHVGLYGTGLCQGPGFVDTLAVNKTALDAAFHARVDENIVTCCPPDLVRLGIAHLCPGGDPYAGKSADVRR